MTDSLSFQKAVWQISDVDLHTIGQVTQAHGLTEIAARILSGRGLKSDDIASFLYPTLKEHLPDPFSMQGMEVMADDISSAIVAKKSFAIFGDFDVDGATSSALLHRFLKHLSVDAPIYIPGRLTEGYGPNADALQALRDDGAEILFLLDCGTTAFEPVAAGREMGLEITILDHHEAEENLPDCAHLINPKRQDDESGLDVLAAVGVTFMACIAINSKLRALGFYTDNNISEPPLISWLDIVALGTVCDMVPLLGVNRLFVKRGFEVMQTTQNPGLQELIRVSKVKPPYSTYHAGFVLGPRINAGSRVHKSDLGARLLSTDDVSEANDIAFTLDDCNAKRKSIQSAMEEEAIAQAEDEGLDEHPVIFVASENFHQGMSGLVAGRLKEKYGKPAVVAAIIDEGGVCEVRGSGRSVAGIHIAQAFIDARQEELITKGGGHAMAGGFSMSVDQIDAFRHFLNDHVARQVESSVPNIITALDAVITVRGATPNLVHQITDAIGPFGQSFAEPLFLLRNVRVHKVDVVGAAHIRVMVSDWEGGQWMKAMAFRAVGTPLGDALLKRQNEAFDLVGTLKIDDWTGTEKTEMHIRDGAFSLSEQDLLTG
ncbi:MAG: single-stranded-DNA-specific exonuclease RecJ [Bdellovibrionales bacterium]